MKTIKRCTKLDKKSEDNSAESNDRQGTYYQFLIERKVPNGILRHIASLINVQYEFIPNNYTNKRQKIDECKEKSPCFDHSSKKQLESASTANSGSKQFNSKVLENLQLKRLEDKSIKLSISKDLDLCSKTLRKPYLNSFKNELSDSDDCDEMFEFDKAQNDLVMKKSKTSSHEDPHILFLKNQKLFPCNLKVGSNTKERCSNPECCKDAKYFITYFPQGKMKISCAPSKPKEINIKKSKGISTKHQNDSTNLGIIRNSKVRYVKAEAFKKHEKIRDMEFEKKLCELTSFNADATNINTDKLKKEVKDSNSHWQIMENSNNIESLRDDSDSDDPKQTNNNEFVIAQQYGSFDDEDNLNSVYSSMNGDSISGDFDLQIVGSKVQLHNPMADQCQAEDLCNPNNVSQLGSKYVIGEPSGDVFGLFYENKYSGIFKDDVEHEFQPINTLQTEN